MAFTSAINTGKRYRLGTRRQLNGNEYIYLQGVASTAVGTWVSFDELGVTTRLVANNKGRVGIAMAATVASTYGWYQIYGSAQGLALTLFADNGAVYTTGTAGSVDDTDVATEAVIGAVGRSAVNETTLIATFELNYPFAHNEVLN